jgi:hypothetical protein
LFTSRCQIINIQGRKSIGKEGFQLAQLLNNALTKKGVKSKNIEVAQMNFNVSGSGESTWYATIRMPEDVVVNSVYVECVGNSRHPSKSNSSILPSSISISAGITNSQMSHAGTAEFKQIGGKTTQNK